MTTIVTETRTWRVIDGARRKLYGQIGLRLIDELTGRGPLGRVSSNLFIENGAGGWRKTNIKPVLTSRGVLAFTRLESPVSLVVGQPARRYRGAGDTGCTRDGCLVRNYPGCLSEGAGVGKVW